VPWSHTSRFIPGVVASGKFESVIAEVVDQIPAARAGLEAGDEFTVTAPSSAALIEVGEDESDRLTEDIDRRAATHRVTVEAMPDAKVDFVVF
jgi:hypothetical protein